MSEICSSFWITSQSVRGNRRKVSIFLQYIRKVLQSLNGFRREPRGLRDGFRRQSHLFEVASDLKLLTAFAFGKSLGTAFLTAFGKSFSSTFGKSLGTAFLTAFGLSFLSFKCHDGQFVAVDLDAFVILHPVFLA